MLITSAREFAAKAHAGIYRPNRARPPYTVHLQEVAELVEKSGGSEAEIAAGWLHDTVEDTDTTLEVIRRLFGEEVAVIVEGMTDPREIGTYPTLQRKLAQAERLKTKSDRVKRVKLADATSNVGAVAIDPPVKWDRQRTLDYIIGSGVVAHMCRDVSRYLDEQFLKAYHAALSAHY
jgi:(p)ppGpp synthase/HD superfamily hydrolase